MRRYESAELEHTRRYERTSAAALLLVYMSGTDEDTYATANHLNSSDPRPEPVTRQIPDTFAGIALGSRMPGREYEYSGSGQGQAMRRRIP